MKGVGSVEPKAEVLFHESFQDEAQVFFKTHEEGIVIKGEIPYSKLLVPVQDFIQNLMRILCEELRVQEVARTVLTPVRAPGRREKRNMIQAMDQVEGGKRKFS